MFGAFVTGDGAGDALEPAVTGGALTAAAFAAGEKAALAAGGAGVNPVALVARGALVDLAVVGVRVAGGFAGGIPGGDFAFHAPAGGSHRSSREHLPSEQCHINTAYANGVFEFTSDDGI